MGFQTVVNQQPAPAVEDDFASANPRSTVLAGPGGLVSGASGVTVGKFAWVEADGATVNSFASGPVAPDGFVHREQQALITAFLGVSSLIVPEGFPITLHRSGDFWAKNLGPGTLVKGDLVYAGYTDGGIYSAAPAAFSGDASIGSTNTGAIGATFTAAASVASDELVISAVTGLISIGDTVAGSGLVDSPTILSQVSGTTGGAGTYTLSSVQTCTGGTVTSFGNVLKITASTGLVSIGDTVAGGSGFPVAAVITGQVSGTTGGTGVYTLSAPATEYVASAAGVTTFGNVLNVGTATSGLLEPGQAITGTNIPATSVASQVSGTPGGIGVYTLFEPATEYVASEAITTAGGIVTAWYAVPTEQGDGAVGNLVKISLFVN